MRLVGIHDVRFGATNLDATERFAADFGLIRVQRTPERLLMRTAGGDSFSYVAEKADRAHFAGMSFEAESSADLEEAVARHGATPARALETPGGGRAVTLTDPNGFKIDIVTGVNRSADAAPLPDLVHNAPHSPLRFGRNQLGRPLAPPQLFRLGHVGLFVRNFAESASWYENTLGLIGSDVYHIPANPKAKIVGFFRLNRGEKWVDHHTVALFQRERPDCHHISFEVQDFEAQFVAHRWLKDKGYESIWGVGRHPHGSHVFDVWRDPDGYRFETFSDTDLLRAADGTRVHDIQTVQMDVWSSDPPDRYFA